MSTPQSVSSRPHAQGYLAGVFCLLAIVAPLLAIYFPLGVAPTFAIGAALTLAAAIAERRRPVLHGRGLYALLALLLAWAALGWLWSINPQGTLKTILQLVGLIAGLTVLLDGAARLDSARARQVGVVLAFSLAVALVVYVVERAFGSPIQALLRPHQDTAEGLYSPFNRGLSVLFVFAPPAAVALRRIGRPYLAALLLGAALAVGFAYYGTSVQVGLLCGIVAGAATLLRPARVPAFVGALFALGILLAPVATSLTLSDKTIDWAAARMGNFSAAHRLVIWHFVTERIAERPVSGWGLDSSRVMPGGKELRPIQMRDVRPDHVSFGEKLPLHPHNMALQWWLELGLPGALIGAGIVLRVFFGIGRLAAPATDKALFAAQGAVAVGIAALSYGIWQSWWLATLALAAMFSAVVIAIAPRADETPR